MSKDKMKTELYKSIKAINIKNLTKEDKEELLRIFKVTKNALIRNQIAFIFADLHYDKAVPFILKKINEKDVLHNNGSLVHSLEDLDLKKYFIPLIKIICEHEYESRLIAYGIIEKLNKSISSRTRQRALKLLEDYRIKLKKSAIDRGENSTLHFIERTKQLLK